MSEIHLLDLKGVEQITSLSHGYIVKLSQQDDFPKPVQVGSEKMYEKSAIVAWAEARADARAAARAGPGEIRRIVRVSVDGTVRHSSR